MTTQNPDYRPRLTIDVSPEAKARLDRIPWGLLGHLFRQVVDDVLDLIDERGVDAFVIILHKLLPKKDYLSIAREVNKYGDTQRSEEKHTGDDGRGACEEPPGSSQQSSSST